MPDGKQVFLITALLLAALAAGAIAIVCVRYFEAAAAEYSGAAGLLIDLIDGVAVGAVLALMFVIVNDGSLLLASSRFIAGLPQSIRTRSAHARELSTTRPATRRTQQLLSMARERGHDFKSTAPSTLRVACTLAILVGFFMPWWRMGPISLTGYELFKARAGYGVGPGFHVAALGGNEQLVFMFFLYAIPITSGFTLLAELSLWTTTFEALPGRQLLAAVTGALPIGCFLYTLVSAGYYLARLDNEGMFGHSLFEYIIRNMFHSLGVGLLVALGGAIVLIGSALHDNRQVHYPQVDI